MLSIGFALACIGAVLVGWSVNHGGICAVGATQDLVHRRTVRRIVGILLASAVAGVVLLPTAWLSNGQVHLAGAVAIGGSLIVGAVLLGLGAVVNDACLFGSLGRLGDGELRFLGLPVGLAIGFAITRIAPVEVTVLPAPLAAPSVGGAVVIALSAVLLIATAAILARDCFHLDEGRRPLLLAMVVLGLFGTMLYAARPGWAYADALHREFGPGLMMLQGGGGLILALLSVAASVGTAVVAGRFVLRRPDLVSVGRSILGGIVMALGAVRVPGGNDSLVLAALPSGTPSGVLAYGVMTLTVVLLVGARPVSKRWSGWSARRAMRRSVPFR